MHDSFGDKIEYFEKYLDMYKKLDILKKDLSEVNLMLSIVTDKISDSGGLIETFNCDFVKLCTIIGFPKYCGEDWTGDQKTFVQWDIEWETKIYHIYNYKDCINYDIHKKSIFDIDEWHIGGAEENKEQTKRLINVILRLRDEL